MQTFRGPDRVRYCVIGILYANQPDIPQLLADEGKILVWSTLAEAQSALPRLGGSDRVRHWSADQETICWTPLDASPGGFNRAVILTGYDPYNLPAGGIPQIRSEAHGLEWRHHVLWSHVMGKLLAWADCAEAERQAADRGAGIPTWGAGIPTWGAGIPTWGAGIPTAFRPA